MGDFRLLGSAAGAAPEPICSFAGTDPAAGAGQWYAPGDYVNHRQCDLRCIFVQANV